MPIRKFEYYGQAKIQKKLSLDELQGKSIAIDGFWYIKKYLIIDTEQQFLNHLSDLPSFLAPLVELSKKTKILWIWDGLEFKKGMHVELKTFIDKILSKIINGKFSKMLFDQELFVENITQMLRKNNISVIRAPYFASAQCVYFYKKRAVDFVFSKNDALLFNDKLKLILEIDYKSAEIEMIDSEDFYKINEFGLQTFRKIAFLSGCEMCPTVPFYANDFDILGILDLIKTNALEKKMSELKKDAIKPYLEEYHKSFIVVDYHPVMSLNGDLTCLNELDAPADIEKIFGKIPPTSFFQKLFTCSVGIKAISGILFQKQKEDYKSKILNFFENLYNNRVDHKKDYKIKDYLIVNISPKLADVEFTDEIEAFAQLAFVTLFESFDKETLLHLLNSGTPFAAMEDLGQNDLLKIVKRYPSEKLEDFCKLSECIVIIKDCILYMNAIWDLNEDISFDFHLNKFLQDYNKDKLVAFLDRNQSLADTFSSISEAINNSSGNL